MLNSIFALPESKNRVIDPKFAKYSKMRFDTTSQNLNSLPNAIFLMISAPLTLIGECRPPGRAAQ